MAPSFVTGAASGASWPGVGAAAVARTIRIRRSTKCLIDITSLF
jgi:hypothetical protein